jgi:hypothetical protein
MGLQVAITGCNSAPTILRIGANFNHRQALRIGQGCRVKDAAEVATKDATKPPYHQRRLFHCRALREIFRDKRCYDSPQAAQEKVAVGIKKLRTQRLSEDKTWHC